MKKKSILNFLGFFRSLQAVSVKICKAKKTFAFIEIAKHLQVSYSVTYCNKGLNKNSTDEEDCSGIIPTNFIKWINE